jgi:LysM repeat protein
MKILKIFGWVLGAHLAVFLAIFATPGCSSGPRSMPTPDATVPTASSSSTTVDANSFTLPAAQPVDLGTGNYTQPLSSSGHAAPTRPGSAAAVAVTPAKPVENVAPVSTYTVERGDSLWSIAKKHNMTVAELAKANSLTTGTALKPGRKLIVPGKPGAPAKDLSAPTTTTVSAAPVTVARPAGGEAVKHTVASGESLGVIARKYQVSVGELAAANNITDPSKVRAGQQLVIPGFKAVSSKGSVSASRPAAGTTAPAASTSAPAPAETTPSAPKFEIAPPPPGQDLDAGLKPADTEVPTVKVEEPAPTTN